MGHQFGALPFFRAMFSRPHPASLSLYRKNLLHEQQTIALQ